VQDALFRAYRSLDTYDDSRPLGPWLFRIAHNHCIDYLRSRGVREEAEAAAAEQDFIEPDDLFERTVGPAIERMVLSLPPKERACVLLKDVFEYSLEEIAELVDSTVGGVKAALNRGRTKLAATEERSAAQHVSAPEHRQILRLYVELFNRRDWDRLRELISADARLLVADRFAGTLAEAGYFGVYSRMKQTWRLTVGEVDNEPAIILLNLRNESWEIEGIVRLDIAADGRIEHISDYQHCPWTLTAGSIVVGEPVA
jgi:RNA polymerase sigma-70 factor (ECF subfamily)